MLTKGIKKYPTQASFLVRLIAGAVIIAVSVSLGIVIIADLVGFTFSPAIPAVMASIAAALFAARFRKASAG